MRVEITWTRVALVLAGLGALGAGVVMTGVVPVAASSEHWAITRWFLDLAMSRSVSTHSLGVEVPDLEDPALVLRGAGHYELGCSPCHGRPGLGRSEIVLEMTPHPPLLQETLHLWEPAELFYIVRHGVKFTSMPAWPVAGRDDEVWAMVAFLLALPGMDERTYLRLALGEMAEVAGEAELARAEGALLRPGGTRPTLRTCARCHGVQGRGRGLGAFPILAGQSATYLASSLAAFASGERPSGTMHAVAAPLDPSVMVELAAHFEAAGGGAGWLVGAAREGVAAGSPEAAGRGGELARRGVPDLKVPACVACHGPTEHPRNPAYPVLGGQHARYLLSQLRLFADRRRGGTEFSHLMHAAVQRMTPEQMEAVAAYYASLGGG